MSARSPITTHVLDVSLGKPAAGIAVVLSRQPDGETSTEVARGTTDGDGRIADLLPPGPPEAGRWRLDFAVGEYFAAQGRPSFYPAVSVIFEIAEAAGHYHVPLLLSPFGYSTYRGS